MNDIREELEKKLKDLDFQMKELRDNEPDEYKKLSKIVKERMVELTNMPPTKMPPQLSLMMQGLKRTEEINIVDAEIGLIQWVLQLLK
ncbi:MAG: hypothetical protein V3W20_12145 [Candidatus Neomarinimicrobiota bacterium]